VPIISEATRRHPKVRALYGVIYLILAAGAITMVYPFLLMLSGSTKSAVDMRELKVVPSFLHDDAMLYRKHTEGLFNESLDRMNIAYHELVPSFEAVEPPDAPNRKLAGLWYEFLDSAKPPPYMSDLGYTRAEMSGVVPERLRAFKRYLADKYGDDIQSVNKALGRDFLNWTGVFVSTRDFLLRGNMPTDEPFTEAFWEFKARQPRHLCHYPSPEGFYLRFFLQARYGREIEKYNEAHSTHYASYADVHLSRRMPEGTVQERSDWEPFVRETLNLLWIRADAGAAGPYREFLAAKYGTIDALNNLYETSYKNFEDVPLIEDPPHEGIELSDWDLFVTGWTDPDTKITYKLPADMMRVHSLDFQFRDYVRDKYGSIDAVNAALGTSYKDFISVMPPQRDAHYLAFLDMKGALRWEFTTRNFRMVFDYLVLHGRGIINTVIYCGLAVAMALIVNPLAAYAMSRHKMASTYKILLILMLTMAFPPMVTQIPAFLMLREFRLLNTFAALVLPGLANGFSIFLLKGFFDSLPRELYDAAAVDGAGEWTIFWHITMSLSKPILSVIALGAFTAAYSNFMFALLICQDEKMWTLMVWLYQLQQRSGQPVVYASLILAAIPTFIVFVFCQKIILRGIVVPTEK